MELLDHGGEKLHTHTIFVDSPDDAANFNPVEFFDTHPDLIDNTSNRMKINQIKSSKVYLQ